MNPIVIKLSGKVLDDPSNAEPLWSAIASATKDIPFVIVHGGGKQVDALLQRLGEQTTRVEGIRVTPESQIDLVSGVLAGQVSMNLIGALKAAGIPAVGVSLGDAGMLGCEQAGAKLGRVGTTKPSRAELIRTLLTAGYVPVVNSIGLDDGGQPLNVNADNAAVAVAGSICARELLYVSDVPGLLDASQQIVSSISLDQVESLIHEGIASGGMAAKLRSASDALMSGVELVRLTDTEGAVKRLIGEHFIATSIHMGSQVRS